MPRKRLWATVRLSILAHMSTVTKTLKLPFLHLNRTKVEEFDSLAEAQHVCGKQ